MLEGTRDVWQVDTYDANQDSRFKWLLFASFWVLLFIRPLGLLYGCILGMVLGFAVPLAIIIYYDMQEPAGISEVMNLSSYSSGYKKAAKVAAHNKRAAVTANKKVVPGLESTRDDLVLAEFDAKEM